MVTFAVQYLENVPGVAAIAPGDARTKLHVAFELLPISYVLLGWNLPEPLVSACREEVAQAGAQFFRWHPLLTGDGTFVPQPEWQTIGLQGEPVPGFQSMPEFTFVCPNRSEVREAVLNHLHQVMQRGDYDGVFLDRIRYPSPAADPARWLACFCDDCYRTASEAGLDLEAARRRIGQLLATPQRIQSFVQVLLGPRASESTDPDIALLSAFLDFRARSVDRFVRAAADLIHAEGLTVALDCFSPALTRMVGQDLGALGDCGEWTKVMTYGHTLGPAGLPFEILNLADWLIEKQQASELQALEWLSRATRLSLPHSRAELRAHGLAPTALLAEIGQARAAGIRKLLAGIELVEIEGMAHLDQEQIEADLRALYMAGADGLVLSWDLWHIPLERLQLVSAIWTQ
ncbi:MAG: hypothetical protein ACETWR_23030 [Anaerolineae bacterium]